MCRCPGCLVCLTAGLDFSSNLPFMLPELLDSPSHPCPVQLGLDLWEETPESWAEVSFDFVDVNYLSSTRSKT